MKPYTNQSGKSGISHYRAGKDFIEIRFVSEPGFTYTYNNKLNGKKHIDMMKKLADKGSGLSTYIAQHPEVRDHFIKK